MVRAVHNKPEQILLVQYKQIFGGFKEKNLHYNLSVAFKRRVVEKCSKKGSI